MAAPAYTVIIRGQPFILGRDQIEFDSPNFFTNCFLGDFLEAESRTVTLYRNPALFAIIVEYLSGYEIFPLNASSLPPTMTVEVAMKNLAADALFYGLQGLHTKIVRPVEPNDILRTAAKAMRFSDPVVELGDLANGTLPRGVQWHSDHGLSRQQEDGSWLPVLVHAKNITMRYFYAMIARDTMQIEDQPECTFILSC